MIAAWGARQLFLLSPVGSISHGGDLFPGPLRMWELWKMFVAKNETVGSALLKVRPPNELLHVVMN